MIQLHISDLLSITTGYTLSFKGLQGMQETLAILIDIPLKTIQNNWECDTTVSKWYKLALERIKHANLEWIDATTQSFHKAVNSGATMGMLYNMLGHATLKYGEMHQIPPYKNPNRKTYQSRKLKL